MVFLRLLRALFHTWLLFVLPWVIGLAASSIFETSQVRETSGDFFLIFMGITMPLLCLQIISIAVRFRRELRAQRLLGRRGFAVWVECFERHARLLTPRGVGLVFGAGTALLLALGAKWGQFAVMSIAGLGLLYLCVTAATLASAFSILAFDERSRRKRGRIERRMDPPLATVGDPVSEEFTLERVPVPPLYRLHISEALPKRLGGETRFVVDRNAGADAVTVKAPVSNTARGNYEFGPAEIRYEDVFGLTRVMVASMAQVHVRILPRVWPVAFKKNPRSFKQSDGPMSRLARFPNEDFYKIREYLPGDDVRRIHWKRSIQLGKMNVRVAETVPYRPQEVVLVLDSCLPPGLRSAQDRVEDTLDLMIEGWVAVAKAMLERGEKVKLIAAVLTKQPNGSDWVELRAMDLKRGELSRIRAFAADIQWQSALAPSQVAEQMFQKFNISSIVWVTAALAPPPALISADSSILWVDYRKLLPPPPKERSAWAKFLTYPFPAGSDENRVKWTRLFGGSDRNRFAEENLLQSHAGSGAGTIRSAAKEVMSLERRGAVLSIEQI
jgi:uncharacterized protein (DUF58 family)